MSVVFAPVLPTASAIVLKTGTPSTSCPPLPGVTPATTFVPYARLRRPWKRPSLPVRPWTTSRVPPSTTIATLLPPLERDPLQRHAAVGDAVREQLAHACGFLARAAGSRE